MTSWNDQTSEEDRGEQPKRSFPKISPLPFLLYRFISRWSLDNLLSDMEIWITTKWVQLLQSYTSLRVKLMTDVADLGDLPNDSWLHSARFLLKMENTGNTLPARLLATWTIKLRASVTVEKMNSRKTTAVALTT